MFFNPNMHFSGVNFAMVSQNPCDSLNLLWNQQREKISAESTMFMTPNFDASIGWEYPEFGMYGNDLCNPMLAIKQCFANWQNNGFANMFSNFQFPGLNGLPFAPWGSSNSGSSSSDKTVEEQLEERKVEEQITALKGILTELKENAEDELSPTLRTTIDIALNKTSNKDTELERNKEILETLKNAYKSIEKNTVKKVLASHIDVKEMLYQAGFNFDDSDYSFSYKDDKTGEVITAIATTIGQIGDEQVTCTAVSGIQADEVLRIISAWNNEHTSNDERSIIRALNKQILTIEDNGQKQSAVESVVKPFTTALINKSKSILNEHKNKFSNGTSEIEKQIAKLEKDLSKALTIKDEKESDVKTILNELSTSFETLYLSMRKFTALAAQKVMANKYSFIDEIESGSSDDVVNNELFIDATIADLKNEGFTSDKLRYDDFKIKETNNTDPSITPKLLEEQGTAVNVKNKNGVVVKGGQVYKYQDKYYQVKNNKVEELFDVTEIENAEDLPTMETLEKDGKKVKATKNGKEITKSTFYKYNDKYYYVNTNGEVKELTQEIQEKQQITITEEK